MIPWWKVQKTTNKIFVSVQLFFFIYCVFVFFGKQIKLKIQKEEGKVIICNHNTVQNQNKKSIYM